jgi:endoglycosylceramidase
VVTGRVGSAAMRRPIAAPVLFAGFLMATLAPATATATATATVAATPQTELLPLHATHGPGAAIVDSDGRQVLLRGMNLSALGDYYLPNPAYPAPVPLKPTDFPEMAVLGFNVVRLLVHWSALEPERDVIDESYLQEIRNAVAAAAANGLYVVIDMHQDAWGKYIASPPGTVCPPGATPAIGWDGAPEWATIFDPGSGGVNTCRGGSREDSPAVRQAWDNFYADTDGIMSELIELWGILGAEFAHEPAVAGYDLLNEPNEGTDPATNLVRLGEFFDRSIRAIRAGEQDAGGLSHIAFFETSVLGSVVPYDFTADENIVFSGHNYGESITPLPMEVIFGYFVFNAEQYGAPLWIGEWGWFGDPPANAEKVARYARHEDELGIGGAWWQWIQACGDPHSIGTDGGTPSPLLIHFKTSECPGDTDLGPVPEWATVLSRPYPRATPGRIGSLSSDGAAATMSLAASTPERGEFDVWVPDRGTGTPTIGGANIGDVSIVAVQGGWRVTGYACDDYEVTVNEGATITGNCEAPLGPQASPAPVAPRFTG